MSSFFHRCKLYLDYGVCLVKERVERSFYFFFDYENF